MVRTPDSVRSLALSLAAAGAAAGALRAQYVEPTATRVFAIPGRSTGDLFGWRVRALGDVNQDSVPDFAVSAPFHQLNLGRVSVHSGRDGAELWGRDGALTSTILGFDLVALRDVDGDGARDVAAGGPFAANSGVVLVWSGRTGAVLRTLAAPGGAGSFGVSLATGGDYDGDGAIDLAIADDANSTSGALRGQVFVYSTATWTVVRSIAPPPGGFLFGTTLAFVGDVDGDGRSDLAIGDRLATTGPAGRLHLVGFDGANDVVRWTATGLHYGSDIDGNKLDGAPEGGGDVNGDGVPDVIADESSAHRARVFSGADGAVVATFTGSGSDAFGEGASIVGDQNRDGVADFLIGVRLESSQAHWNGRAVLLSGRDGRQMRRITNTTVDALFGSSLDVLGDVTGDGWPDLVIGAAGASGFTRSMGGVHVVAGDPFLAGWSNYGAGAPGSLGVPSITLVADPVLGAGSALRLGNAAGATAPGLFVLGNAALIAPQPFGTLLVRPDIVSAVTLPAGGLSLAFGLPPDPLLLGVSFFGQVFHLDGGVIGSAAASAGLRADLGR